MYRIELTSRVINNFVVVIEEDSKEVFNEKLKHFVGPNSGWVAPGLPMYIDRFWFEFINACKC